MPQNMLSLLHWVLIFSRIIPTRAATDSTTTTDTYHIFKSPAIAKPSCPTKCGNLTVPYPFGIGLRSGCAIAAPFELNCTAAAGGSPPRALIGANIQVHDISDDHLRVSNSNVMTRLCYEKSGAVVRQNTASSDIRGTPFSYSDLNRFHVVGCDDFGVVMGSGGREFTSGCVAVCEAADDVINGSCSGVGCCEMPLPRGLQYYLTWLRSLNNHTTVSFFDPCSYAFLGEADRFVFRGAPDLSDPLFMQRIRNTVPIVLDWAVGNKTCAEVQGSRDYACKGNSECVDSGTGLGGFRCRCKNGYEGNPYLDPGCVDINECEDSNLNMCEKICVNTLGSFGCSCPKGQFGNGRKDGKGCNAIRSEFPVIKVALAKDVYKQRNLDAMKRYQNLSSSQRQEYIAQVRKHKKARSSSLSVKSQIIQHECDCQFSNFYWVEDQKTRKKMEIRLKRIAKI